MKVFFFFFFFSFLPMKSRTFFRNYLEYLAFVMYTVCLKDTAGLLFAEISHVPCIPAPQIKIWILTPQIS